MTPRQAAQYLHSFIDFEHSLHQLSAEDFKLDRMVRLLETVDRPQDQLRVVHVAGSKGKGSTSAMVAQILSAAGYKVGLYTSPHIHSFHERIRILGDDQRSAGPGLFPDAVTDEELAALLSEYQVRIEAVRENPVFGRVTYYEVLTALAFLFFVRQKTDIAVLETGLGGRLDATNVGPSEVAVITPIGLEHTQILGDTLAEIAGEKAAIIKDRRQAVIIAPQPPEVAAVVEARCRSFSISPVYVRKNMINAAAMELQGQIISVQTNARQYAGLRINLAGEHQQVNALTAIHVVEALDQGGLPVPEEAVYRGLAAVRWPIRFEVVGRQPDVIIDAAHSVESMRELAKTVRALLDGRRIYMIAGVSSDKRIGAMCTEIGQMADVLYLTKADHPRAYTFGTDDVERYFSGVSPVFTENVQQAVARARQEAAATDVILITGSIFVASEARRIWNADGCDVSRSGS
ncbi:MAG: bifunctional folylpolyglutamate synthase/dihydrofolate synthase [Candidatus Omnitrophica bacterium]|nr:bifunctional folylpolyglutamate synthase/dihydrofolate synthase [Candidatus Omnitrophota bacterium]